jgi:hypothetical protein
MTTLGFANLKTSPFAGPEVTARTTTSLAGSFNPSSAGGSFKFEVEASARANAGSGLITTVWSARRWTSTTVVFPHFEHLNCTFGWTVESASFSLCSVPQWTHAACITLI